MIYGRAEAKDLFYQIIFGSSQKLNAALWYLLETILIILFFTFIRRKVSYKIFGYILVVMFFFSIIMQYTGLNFALFSKWPYECCFLFGRFFEMIPYACLGFGFRYLEKQKKNSLYLWIIMITSEVFAGLCLLLFIRGQRWISPTGFVYPGLFYICFVTGIFAFTLILPNLDIKFNRMVDNLSRVTLGVYCLHIFVGRGLQLLLPGPQLLNCLIIWMTCFVIVILLNRIPLKWIKKLIS